MLVGMWGFQMVGREDRPIRTVPGEGTSIVAHALFEAIHPLDSLIAYVLSPLRPVPIPQLMACGRVGLPGRRLTRWRWDRSLRSRRTNMRLLPVLTER